jgi:hypothetical protein
VTDFGSKREAASDPLMSAPAGCGHSVARGYVREVAPPRCSAIPLRLSQFKMMDVSRHRSVETLRGYVRDAELFKDHAGAGLL